MPEVEMAMGRSGVAWRLEPSEEPGDAEIVREVLGGAPERFDVLVRRHRARLRRVAGAVLRDPQETEDAVQQALLQAFAGLDRWAGTAPFATWLSRIAMNEALMRARRSRRLERAALRLVSEAAEAGTPEQEVAWREAMAQVEAALPRLPQRHLEVLRLAAVDELPHADVAAQLGVSPGAVKVRLHRAREALRGLMEERDDAFAGPRRDMPAPDRAAKGSFTRWSELPSG
jgi:RNA polymerase sigma-70 factor (ECF subfamily)